ncbi:ABC transporter ATP-binding protein [Phytoactinopolyspora alkaliphila]|uniref:ABC transporter ATP-binding protein n=1 Tax=Phytoactinopolyspora alkaliphila TaxID=1783498 RepID=A0A6N9YQ02_9ACTN|nr:ABC transporter ATP-binding protein [Phytoactinopolyspora alkaliphila]NED97044.1 ABC transporter ATP-binding protein [Phytoactinopolyspora alkaliphila]
MNTVISVEHLRKTYGDVIAIDDVSFEVRHGEVFGILGSNGAGKTTTVEILQGLRARTGGRLEVLGLDPGRETDRLRRRIGSQLQSSALPERLRVIEAVRLFARLRDEPVDVDGAIQAWGLEPLRNRPFGVLSGGERQRLFVALALLGDPELVLLDELTTGLDPTARRATWELVRQMRDRGATVVLVTHFMEEAEALCDRVAVMDAGRVVACDTPHALTARQGGPVTITFSAIDGHDPRSLLTVPGVASVDVDGGRVSVTGHSTAAARVAAALIGQGVTPTDYRTHYPSLEDVFLTLTGRQPSEGEAT